LVRLIGSHRRVRREKTDEDVHRAAAREDRDQEEKREPGSKSSRHHVSNGKTTPSRRAIFVFRYHP
jgi:hypothetical protein